MKDYAHIMFRSQEIINEKQIKDALKTTDRIQICTIIDDSNKKNGEYRVQVGNATFIAYSEANYYKKGEQVRVSILGGDETKKKFIIGRYSGIDEQKPLTYVSPLDQILDITGNLAPATAAHPNGVTANSERTSVKIFSITDSENSDFKLSSIYDSISLSADFKTFLANSSLASGDYGLRLEVFFTENKKENYYLSVADMFGNPYSFSIPTKQSKVFSIDKENKNITRVDAYLYQDKNFIDFNGASLPVLKDSSGLEIPNIIVSNVRLGLGDDLLTIEDKTINLYTENSLNYVYDESNTTDNVKRLKLLWYNKNDQNAYIGFSDGIYDPDYDELEYLQISDIVNGRLRFKGLENIPYDETSLDLANHRETIYTTLEKAINIYEGDYLPLLVSLMRKVGLIPETNEDINTLQEYGESWTADKENINMVYTNLLTNVYNIQQGKLKVPPQEPQDVDLSNETEILNNWPLSNEDLIDELIAAAMIVDRLIDQINVHNSQNKNLKNDQDRLNSYWNKIYSLILNLPNDENILKEYLKITYDNYNLNDYPEYKGEELEAYDGKYCIYLYRYDSSYTDYTNDKIFASPGWERLVKDNGKTNWANELLPDKLGETTYQPRDTSKFVEWTMRHDKKEEKFIAVIVFNHQIFRSQELIFTNIDANKIIDKNILATLSDKLIIEHEENSRNDYFLYNFSGDIVNYKDSRLDRKLRCHFNSIDISDVTGAFQNATMRWYVPNTNTNLTCDEEELIERGFQHIVDSSKVGYDCYQKIIKVNEPEDGETWSYIENGVDGRDFWYQIKDYYFETYFNNTIICEVQVPGRETIIAGEISFTFGFLGSSGTGYTLVAEIDSPFLSNKNSVTIVWYIKDKEGNIVIPNSDGKAEVIYKTGTIDLVTTYDTKGVFTTTCGRGVPTANLGDVCIIELSCSIIDKDNGVILTRKIPIGAALGFEGAHYEYCGLTQIIYDSYGSLANEELYTTNPIEIYYNNQPVQEITCSITYPGLQSGDTLSGQQVKIKGKTLLNPASLYFESNSFPVVEVKYSTNTLLYRQPLAVYQNAYQSTVLNNWDGSFTVDEDSGTVLSTMLGAGRKNSYNKFEGVLLGDVKSGADVKTGIGLYGFNNGVQSFGFNINGTAFIGKSGGGRILFDGSKSTITSQGFDDNDQGIKFDLDQPYLHIKAKSDVSSTSLFQITLDGNTLINISDNSYYLQDKDQTFKINLNTGLISAQKLKINAWNDSNGGFWLDTGATNGGYLFKVGDKGNYIQLQKSSDIVYGGTASLSIQATNFNLAVGRTSSGWVDFNKNPYMILNSHPRDDWYYFKMGNGKGSDITFHKDGSFSISVDKFKLSAGTKNSDGYLYLSNNNVSATISGTTRSDWRLCLGQKCGITSSGVIYAKDAVLTGSLSTGSIASFNLGDFSFSLTNREPISGNGIFGPFTGTTLTWVNPEDNNEETKIANLDGRFALSSNGLYLVTDGALGAGNIVMNYLNSGIRFEGSNFNPGVSSWSNESWDIGPNYCRLSRIYLTDGNIDSFNYPFMRYVAKSNFVYFDLRDGYLTLVGSGGMSSPILSIGGYKFTKNQIKKLYENSL